MPCLGLTQCQKCYNGSTVHCPEDPPEKNHAARRVQALRMVLETTGMSLLGCAWQGLHSLR